MSRLCYPYAYLAESLTIPEFLEAQLLGYMNHHIFRDIFRFCWETAFMLKIFQQNGLPQLIVRGVPAEQA